MLSRSLALSVLPIAGAPVPRQAAPRPSPPRPSMSVEAAAYLAEALAVIREHSFHREKLDWSAIRRSAFDAAAGVELPVDTYEALRGALAALGDHHSFLQLPAELERLESERRAARGILAAAPTSAASRPVSPFATRRNPEGRVHETDSGAVAQIVVPFFMGADVDRFAQKLQAIVAELDQESPLGWIVDLRGNGGGNMWPMLAGIGPILGEGRVGAFLDLEGVHGHWYYRGGKAGVETDGASSGFVGATVDRPHSLKEAPPVAVLIDGGTGSSGEAVAIAFK